MTDSRINVFISHVNADETLACGLKEFLQGIFRNANVFVSGRDLEGGQIWIEALRNQLAGATAIVALVTRFSVESRWVHFEAGAGFAGQRTIPLVADGVTTDTLTAPLRLLQARSYDRDGLQELAKDIARRANMRELKKFANLDETLQKAATFIRLRAGSETIDTPKVLSPALSERGGSRHNFRQHDLYRNVVSDPALLDQIDDLRKRACSAVVRDILRQGAAFEMPATEDIAAMDFFELQRLARTVGTEPPYELTSLTFFPDVPSPDAPAWKKVNHDRQIDVIKKALDAYEREIGTPGASK